MVFCVTEVEELIGPTETKIVSDTNMALLVRQMSIHADVCFLNKINSCIKLNTVIL